VSGVAHELNNPLSVIIGYGQLLLSRDVPQMLKRPSSSWSRRATAWRRSCAICSTSRASAAERASVDMRQVMEQTLALRLNH